MAAVDALVLPAVLAALGFRVGPHIRLLLLEARALLHPAAPLAGAVDGAVLGWGLMEQQARKCGQQRWRGLKKAVEFDIQLETEECVHGRPRPATWSALLTAVGAGQRSSRTSRRR